MYEEYVPKGRSQLFWSKSENLERPWDAHNLSNFVNSFPLVVKSFKAENVHLVNLPAT